MEAPAPNQAPTEFDLLNSRLAEMEAAQAAESGSSAAPGQDKGASATEAAQRAAAGEAGATKTSTDQTGTPSAAKAGEAPTETNKPGEAKAGDQAGAKAGDQAGAKAGDQAGGKAGDQAGAKGSKYAQDLERRDKSWKALNAEKEAFAAERTKAQQDLERDRAAVKAEREAWNQERQAAEQQNSPEHFEQWAGKQADKVKQLTSAATQAEDEGDFEKAEKLKAAAAQAKAYENLARQQAEHLRRNPPATAQQRQAETEKQNKEWTLKAATDFPEFAKKESPVQAEAVNFLRFVGQNFPQLGKHPQLVYFAAERAKLKIAADRVPALEKELETAKNRVAELEKLHSPPGPGGAAHLPGEKTWDQMSPEEQFNQLRQEGAAMR